MPISSKYLMIASMDVDLDDEAVFNKVYVRSMFCF